MPVVVVNPAQLRAFAQALGKRAKTDPIDAIVIARFAEATKPTIRPLADVETTALADLIDRFCRGRPLLDVVDVEFGSRRIRPVLHGDIMGNALDLRHEGDTDGLGSGGLAAGEGEHGCGGQKRGRRERGREA